MKKLVIGVIVCLVLALSCRADGGYIALTFDDGPTGKYTERLCELLAREQVRATFFLCGYRVEQYPLLAQRLADDGHELGLHGCSHRYFTDMSEEELTRELTDECYRIAEVTGVAPQLLRPPGGLMPSKLSADSVLHAFPVILWSVDPQDWATQDARAVVRRVTGSVRAGDVILLHDAGDSSVAAAEQIIRTLTARGFTFVTVSELAAHYGVPLTGGERYHRFR